MRDFLLICLVVTLFGVLAGCNTTNRAQVSAAVTRACGIRPAVAIVNSIVGTLTAGPAGAAGADAVNAAEAAGCAIPR